MSRNLNKVMLIGNLGSDPEIRTTGSGARVAQMSLATSRSWTDRGGEIQERTEWHRVVCWEKLAEIAERFLKKGERVYVEGEIEYRSYEAKDGSGTRYTTEIRARELMMLGTREGGAGRAAERPRPAPATVGAGVGGGYGDFEPPPFEEEDDLPF
jgi:single-strand DNA-binding protein